MKIVISATGNTKESLLDKRFGRCEIFQIYDTESDSYEFAVNSGAFTSGGAGIKAAGTICTEHNRPNFFRGKIL